MFPEVLTTSAEISDAVFFAVFSGSFFSIANFTAAAYGFKGIAAPGFFPLVSSCAKL